MNMASFMFFVANHQSFKKPPYPTPSVQDVIEASDDCLYAMEVHVFRLR